MKRGFVTSLLVGALLLLAFAIQEPAQADEPAPSFIAHEWGVWVVDAGRVAHLPALAAECPHFVIQTPRRRTPVVRMSMPNVVVEKPVIFFHTNRTIEDVRVRVRFRRGEPWLVWPQARIRGRSVAWRGRLSPRSGAPDLGGVTHHGRPHAWWGHLRRAGGARFEPADGSASEDFLFYDGMVPFRSAFSFSRQGPAWIPRRRGAEAKVWIQDGQGRLVAHNVEPRQMGMGGQATNHPATDLIGLLRTELLSRGLRLAEANSLLNTWRDDLQPSGSSMDGVLPRAVYFVDRASYDRMLPLVIRPTPDELVRVGLVIEILR